MRMQLGSADSTFLDPTTYNQLFTMHGTTMIFLVVVPIFAGFGSYLVPLMIGARGVAFPRLNMLSWWLLVSGGAVLYGSLFFAAPEAGWTSYAPLSDDSFLRRYDVRGDTVTAGYSHPAICGKGPGRGSRTTGCCAASAAHPAARAL
jgi:heme/copper-type cytochrome/quinol oxidase subunit 1